MARHRAAGYLCALGVASGLVGCGKDSNEPERLLTGRGRATQPLAAEERALDRRLATDAEIASTSPGSVNRAFLEYWSALDHEEWPIALAAFPAETQTHLGASRLVRALRIEAVNNHPIKPLIRDVRTRGGQTSVRYFTRRADGKLRPTSMVWKRRDGEWTILYSATLDDSYSGAVQQAVQADVDPTGTKPAEQALREAARAAGAQARGPALASKR